jgi:hypothetical protein
VTTSEYLLSYVSVFINLGLLFPNFLLQSAIASFDAFFLLYRAQEKRYKPETSVAVLKYSMSNASDTFL